MKNKKSVFIWVLFFCCLVSAFTAMATSIDVTLDPTQKSGLYVGESWPATINILNKNAACDIQCQILETGGRTNVIPNGEPGTLSVRFTVDANVPGPQRDTVTVKCWDYDKSWPCSSQTTWPTITATTYYNYCGDGLQNGNEECDGSNIPGSCTNYGYDEGSLKCTGACKIDSSGCTKDRSISETNRNSAQTAISSANTAINNAQSKIAEANKIGADVGSATQYLNLAQTDYNSANNLLSSGNSAFNLKQYSTANSYYQQATSKAESAASNAANTKSTVDRIIEEYNRKKTQAQNKVSDANSAIDTAKQRVAAGDKIISDATMIGLDTAQAKADIATARSKIDTAEDYYKEASNMFSANNFDSAESKASSAITLADGADTLATQAYNKLNERLTVAGESGKSILNANTEVSQMNEILTKMDYIIRSTEKWGVDLTDTKAIVTTAKQNVDSAEDLLSQAKNRQASGSFDDAVNFGNQARDKAASSRNRLDTMAQTILVSTQNALDKASKQLQTKLAESEAEVQSAQNTYGATPEYIIDAQNDLSAAKNSFEQAKNQIATVNSASDLMPLLTQAEQAFKTLDSTEQKIVSATTNAKNAKMGLTKKLIVGAAVAAGGVGGGFLYYRSRKKKKGQTKAEGKKENPKKEHKDEQKTSKFCSKCGQKVGNEKKFCPKCGNKNAVNEMPKCKKCGFSNKVGSKFCEECGKDLKESKNFNNTPNLASGKPKWLLIGIGALVVLGAIFVFAVPLSYQATESYTANEPYQTTEQYTESINSEKSDCTTSNIKYDATYMSTQGVKNVLIIMVENIDDTAGVFNVECSDPSGRVYTTGNNWHNGAMTPGGLLIEPSDIGMLVCKADVDIW